MKYVFTTGWEDGIADLSQALVRELTTGKQVLWLVSGGSNIPATVQVMQNITRALSQNLSIMPADERFGEVGHSDSNWAQLLQAGLEPKQARLLPVLRPRNDFQQTVEYYADMTKKAFRDHDSIIGQFGMGDDGHIAGILPGSVAATEEKALVIGYEAAPRRRLTLTFPALRQVNTAYTFAFGEAKRIALTSLENDNLPVELQPAQILKQIKHAFIYNDQIEMV